MVTISYDLYALRLREPTDVNDKSPGAHRVWISVAAEDIRPIDDEYKKRRRAFFTACKTSECFIHRRTLYF